MKHAILSARLMAEKISKGESDGYPRAHGRVFRRWRLISDLGGRLYDSPFRTMLKPLIRNKTIFFRLYGWLHAAAA